MKKMVRSIQSNVIQCSTAAGFRSNNTLEEALEELCDDVSIIGDAVAPSKILTAVHEGYHAIRVME